MNRLKHEEGATLIIVLLVLVIFSISVSLLSFQINNMAVQFKKTEATIEARHLADMGIEYYKSYVNKTVQSDPDLVDLVFLNNHFMTTKTVTIDEGTHSSFEITPLNISEVDGVFNLEYEVKGTVGIEDVVNHSEITIEILIN